MGPFFVFLVEGGLTTGLSLITASVLSAGLSDAEVEGFLSRFDARVLTAIMSSTGGLSAITTKNFEESSREHTHASCSSNIKWKSVHGMAWRQCPSCFVWPATDFLSSRIDLK
jgi:hypothetical protein